LKKIKTERFLRLLQCKYVKANLRNAVNRAKLSSIDPFSTRKNFTIIALNNKIFSVYSNKSSPYSVATLTHTYTCELYRLECFLSIISSKRCPFSLK
jgi:hypothetical protein